MDLSDEEVERRAAADRREVHPPVQVETALWSRAGQLDWWVKEHRPRLEWFGRVRARTVSSGGSKRVIFVLEAAQSHDLAGNSLNSVVGVSFG
jgi:hypothetical protein